MTELISHTFGVSLVDVAGKECYEQMMDEGRRALAEIAKRLPDHFQDLTEDNLIELFRQARLFMISNKKDYDDIQKLCPDFPLEHIDVFQKLNVEYRSKWMKKRRLEFNRLCAN